MIGGFDLVAGQDVEAEAEFLGQLVLPLLDQTSGRDDEAALKIAADQELLDEQSRHDGLAGAWIVGEQEAQRLTRKHFAVNGRDLVRQRLDLGGADGEVGIEKIGQTDAIGFGGQPEQAAVGVEGVGSVRLPRTRSRFPRRDRRGVRRPGRPPGTRGSERPGRNVRLERPPQSLRDRGRAAGLPA